ncbi:hypothetical protein [Streptomyces microflavus]|uniref:hypothetical protein n=1 Tax=Streptomyces microflavus TaxID=1919 RepID=UPI002E32C43B|nr:hypothetical protein [Streptomyces microflavus]
MPKLAGTAHPLFALIPAGQLDGDLVQVVEVGDGLVTVVATPDSEWGIYDVTGWRHLTDAEIADATTTYPGEPFDVVVPAIAGFVQDDADLDARVTNAVQFLTTRLAELAA